MKYQAAKDFFPDLHHIIDLAENCIHAPKLGDHDERVLKRVDDCKKNRLDSPVLRECVKGFKEILGLIRWEYRRGNEGLFCEDRFSRAIDIILDANTLDRWLKPNGVPVSESVRERYQPELRELAQIVQKYTPEITKLGEERLGRVMDTFNRFSSSKKNSVN